MNTSTMLKAMKESGYNYFGIRGDNFIQKVGSILESSFDWDYENDCQATDKLDGTCTVGIGYLWFDEENEDIETLENAIQFAKATYEYKNFCIVGADEETSGADERESIMKNPDVLIILK